MRNPQCENAGKRVNLLVSSGSDRWIGLSDLSAVAEGVANLCGAAATQLTTRESQIAFT